MIALGCLSFRKNQEKMPTNMGFVVTITTLLATDVYFRDVVQNIKCRPRNTPPASESNRSLPLTALNEMPFIAEKTRRTTDAIQSRYVAIIIAGTSLQNRMNIAAKDIETIPTNSIAMVRTILLQLPRVDYILNPDIIVTPANPLNVPHFVRTTVRFLSYNRAKRNPTVEQKYGKLQRIVQSAGRASAYLPPQESAPAHKEVIS